jgi:hypothetical protein
MLKLHFNCTFHFKFSKRPQTGPRSNCSASTQHNEHVIGTNAGDQSNDKMTVVQHIRFRFRCTEYVDLLSQLCVLDIVAFVGTCGELLKPCLCYDSCVISEEKGSQTATIFFRARSQFKCRMVGDMVCAKNYVHFEVLAFYLYLTYKPKICLYV